MTDAALDEYSRRFRRVLDYVDAHLDEDLSVERLSHVAAFSKYHFHRQFSGLFGISVSKYVQLVRLKRAAYQLAFRQEHGILRIALESGYESQEAFTRAFKKATGQTPAAFRRRPDWEPWNAACRHLSELRVRHTRSELHTAEVSLVAFEATRVAALEHRGAPDLLLGTIRRFIEWRKQEGLSPRTSATLNILYDDPRATPPEDFRLDICAATNRRIGPNAFGVVEKTLPRGRCALLRHVGSDDTLSESVRYLYTTWLPSSGEQTRDFNLFLRRIRFFPDVPEHEAVTDVFLPLQ